MGVGVNFAYVGHKLTAYHWRYNRRRDDRQLAMCDCGWRDPIFRPSLSMRWHRLVCFFLGHHYGKEETWESGPADFEEGQGEFGGTYRQCERCYGIKDTAEWVGPRPQKQKPTE